MNKEKNLMAREAVSFQLENAFRYGSSAFRYGLIPEGISDHLPILSEATANEMPIRMLSWNLLADEHLFNNFMNISGSSIVEDILSDMLDGEANNIYKGAMYHFFAELSQYLYPHIQEGELVISESLMQAFASNAAQPSHLARSRDEATAVQKTQKVERARQAFLSVLRDENHPMLHELQLAIKHSLELIYHIKSPEGALRWENRFDRLCQSPGMVAELQAQDILAFQECTNPEDLKQLISKNTDKDMHFICHNTSRTGVSTDNVVLAYDKNKFNLIGEPILSSFHGKKPEIYCKLEARDGSGHQFIVGSIHHPGGDEDLRDQILASVNTLKAGHAEMPFYIMGDYNHTRSQFVAIGKDFGEQSFGMNYPQSHGTMAGSDYGNTNKAIDSILSNHALDVHVSDQIKQVRPATTALQVSFQASHMEQTHLADAALRPHIYAEQMMFKQRVDDIRRMAQNVLTALPGEHDEEKLGGRPAIMGF